MLPFFQPNFFTTFSGRVFHSSFTPFLYFSLSLLSLSFSLLCYSPPFSHDFLFSLDSLFLVFLSSFFIYLVSRFLHLLITLFPFYPLFPFLFILLLLFTCLLFYFLHYFFYILFLFFSSDFPHPFSCCIIYYLFLSLIHFTSVFLSLPSFLHIPTLSFFPFSSFFLFRSSPPSVSLLFALPSLAIT